MACNKMIVAAAATSLILLSFLLPSGVDAGLQIGAPGCRPYPSRLPSCEVCCCKDRCIQEGNVSGYCDGNKRCICIYCSSSHDGGKADAGLPSSSLLAPEDSRGAAAWP